jgi:three-Cys-motif partner protein
VSQHDDHFEAFEPHTLLKHAILRAYLNAWAMKLLLWGRAGDTVYFVDAFAGAGQDNEGRPGSPLIAARIAAGVPTAIERVGPGRQGRMRVRAIEQHAGRYAALAGLLEPFGEVDRAMARAGRGVLADYIDRMDQEIGVAPALYFLDPFGVKGLDAATYPKLLKGPQNEIFALFADMGATRLHGLVVASRSDVDGQIARLREQATLFPELDAEREQAVRDAAAQRNQALDVSQGPSREYLVRAVGDDGVIAEMEALPPEERPDAFVGAFIKALLRAGARYVLTIPMRNAQAQRVYTLVHASKSAKGFAAMKEAVSAGLDNEELPAEMRERMRGDLAVPMDAVLQHLGTHFAGRVDVPWTAGKGQEPGTVRCHLLEETSVFHFQLPAVRDALEAGGILRKGPRGKLLCTFPAAPARPSGHQIAPLSERAARGDAEPTPGPSATG